MKTAICAQIKDEERYLKEWLDYHLKLGIDHIYLYEDYGSRSHASLIEGYDTVSLMTVQEFDVTNLRCPKTQYHTYCKFLNDYRNEYDWILFIDVDEFVTFARGYNLERIEREYADYPAILLSWKNYGASGHIKRPEGGVRENYTQEGVVVEMHKDLQWAKKSLVNTKLCEGLLNVHIAIGAKDVTGNEDVHAPLVYKKVWISHYFTKSWEDWCERIFERGNMSNNYRTLDNFFECNPDMAHMEKELIESVRNRHCKSTQWLSRKYKLISGGNLEALKALLFRRNKDKKL